MKFGAEVKVADAPELPGYTFSGWTTEDAEVAEGKFTMPAKAVAFTGSFELIEYTITYELDGGTNAEANPAKYTIETETITLADASKTGYTFDGWYSDVEFTTKVTEIAKGTTGNITLYAKFTAIEYTITYNVNDGTLPEGAVTKYTVEDTVTLPVPTREGYGFGGWFDNEELSGTAVTAIEKGSTGDKVFWAKWTAGEEAYKVEHYFEDLEGAFVLDSTKTQNLSGKTDETVTATALTVEGFTFDEANTNNVLSGKVLADGSLVLKVYYTRNSYEVTYAYAESAPASAPAAPAAATVKFGAEVKVADAPELPGYTFSGWTTKDAEVADGKFTMPAKAVAFTGSFAANTYTVKFDKNAAEAAGTMADQAFTYDAEQALTKNAFTKEGYMFKGWALSADGEVAYADEAPVKNLTTEADGTVTLYAVWEKVTWKLDKTFINVAVGETEELHLIGTDGSYGVGTWTSEDEGAATVDQNGVVTGVKYHTGTIKVHVVMDNGYEEDCEVQTRFWDVNGSPNKEDEDYQYYYNAVYWGADHTPYAITKGYDLEYFGVGQGCTRKDFILFLYRLAGQPTVSKADINAMKEAFSDMTNSELSNSFIKAIAWGYSASDPSKRIINGYNDSYGPELAGTFGPERTIKRKEAILMIWRYAGRPDSESTAKFEAFDEIVKNKYKPTSDTYKSIRWAAWSGLSNGYQRPDQLPAGVDITTPCYGADLTCLREDMIVFLYRYAQNFLGE